MHGCNVGRKCFCQLHQELLEALTESSTLFNDAIAMQLFYHDATISTWCNYFNSLHLIIKNQHEPVLLTDFGQYSNVASSSNFNSLCNRFTTFQLSKLEFIKISCTSRHAAPNFPLTRFSGNIQCIADGKCFQFRRKKNISPGVCCSRLWNC